MLGYPTFPRSQLLVSFARESRNPRIFRYSTIAREVKRLFFFYLQISCKSTSVTMSARARGIFDGTGLLSCAILFFRTIRNRETKKLLPRAAENRDYRDERFSTLRVGSYAMRDATLQ